MQARIRRIVLVSLVALQSACFADQSPRIVAIGDLHGDIEATRRAFGLAGAIDDQDHWAGGRLIVVQIGDVLDRGDDEQEILDLFERLRIEAAAAGGEFHALLGNHELMNAEGDLRYVTDGGFADFEDAVAWDADDPQLVEFEPHERARMAAFLPGRPYALLLAERNMILQVGGNLFVHGGLLPEHVAYGINSINDDAKAWLRGEIEFPDILDGSDSPEWTRQYSDEPDDENCEVLAGVVADIGVDRVVMGHTIQEDGITSACEGLAWLIDVGMAAHYGGPVEVLEIVGDSVVVLK